MKAKMHHSWAGQVLVSVVYTRMTLEGAGPEIEVVFEAFWPSDFTLTSNPIVLTQLSVTRTCTRTPDEILLGERQAVFNEAMLAIDHYDQTLLTR